MKHLSNNFSWHVKWYFAMMFFLFIAVTQGKTQTIQRQNIGICGTNMISGGILVKQTIGQPYATSTYYNNGIGYRPGFQQPAGSATTVIPQELVKAGLNLRVYPNPAAYSFSIESQDAISSGLLKVMHSSGKVVIQQKIAELKSYSINCESWTPGLYLISVNDEHHTSYSSKLIITK